MRINNWQDAYDEAQDRKLITRGNSFVALLFPFEETGYKKKK